MSDLDRPSYNRFRAALASGDVAEAFDLAKRLPGLLPLLDALELTLLAGKAGWDGHFQDCAARWLARVAVEKKLKLDSLMNAGEVFQAVAQGEGDDAYKRLAAYL